MTPATAHTLLMGILRGRDAATLLPLVPGPSGWTPLLDEAAAHCLTPLLHRWLKDTDVGRSLPATVADRLERDAFELAARNMLLAGELGGVLRAFADHRVPCAPLRGPALAERLYGDVTARPMGDLDLLVRREDLARVTGLMRGLGFRELDRRPGFAQAFSYTLVFLKDRHGWVIVEPHWTIVYPPFVERLDMAGVWERCGRGRVLGVETWVLGREDLLLHLCLHLAHPDGGAPLLWFYELDRLLRQEQDDVDWSRVLSLTRAAGLEFLLSEALETVTALFGTPIPDHVRPELSRSPSSHERLAGLLAAGAGVDGREELAVFFTVPGWRARVRYALGLLFPCPQFMRVQWGLSSRTQLARAYVGRACRLSWAALKGMLRLLSRPPGRTGAEARARGLAATESSSRE